MSDGVNKAILVGNLGMDPELKYTQGGQAVLRLRMATTESFLDKSGERKERTDWHTVIVWGKRGEGLSKILAKGNRIYVEGSIQTRSWEDAQGGKRNATEIVASNIVLCGGNQQRSSHSGGNDDGDERSQQTGSGYSGGGATDDDSIPFGPMGDIW